VKAIVIDIASKRGKNIAGAKGGVRDECTSIFSGKGTLGEDEQLLISVAPELERAGGDELVSAFWGSSKWATTIDLNQADVERVRRLF